MLSNIKNPGDKQIDNIRNQHHIRVRREGFKDQLSNYRNRIFNNDIPQFKLLLMLNKIRQLQIQDEILLLEIKNEFIAQIQCTLECPKHPLKVGLINRVIGMLKQKEQKKQYTQIFLQTLQFWIQQGFLIQSNMELIHLKSILSGQGLEQQYMYRLLKVLKNMMLLNSDLCDQYFSNDLTLLVIPNFIHSSRGIKIRQVLLWIVQTAQKKSNHSKKKIAMSNLIPILVGVFLGTQDKVKIVAGYIISYGIKTNTLSLQSEFRTSTFFEALINNLKVDNFQLKTQVLNIIGIMAYKGKGIYYFLQFDLLMELSHCLDVQSPQILKYIIWITSNLVKGRPQFCNALFQSELFIKLIQMFNYLKDVNDRNLLMKNQIVSIVSNAALKGDRNKVLKAVINSEMLYYFFCQFQTKCPRVKKNLVEMLKLILQITLQSKSDEYSKLMAHFLHKDGIVNKLFNQLNESNKYFQQYEATFDLIDQLSKTFVKSDSS